MRGVSTEVARDLRKDGWNATTFHLYSHCGTHMDAPLHFEVNDNTIDEIVVVVGPSGSAGYVVVVRIVDAESGMGMQIASPVIPDFDPTSSRADSIAPAQVYPLNDATQKGAQVSPPKEFALDTEPVGDR